MGFFNTAYTNQVIVKAGSDIDGSTYRIAKMLSDKAVEKNLKTLMVDLDVRVNGTEPAEENTKLLKKALKKVTTETRLYLVGHGDWRQQTMGGLKASVWAGRLVECGLKKVPKLISIVGCSAARDKSSAFSPHSMRIHVSIDSFASQFHQILKAPPGGLETIVFARPYTIRTHGGAVKKKTTHKHEGPLGTDKILPPTAGELHHGERRKLCFFWEHGVQKRKWVAYVHGAQQLISIAADELDGADLELPDFGPDDGESPASLTSSIGEIPDFE